MRLGFGWSLHAKGLHILLLWYVYFAETEKDVVLYVPFVLWRKRVHLSEFNGQIQQPANDRPLLKLKAFSSNSIIRCDMKPGLCLCPFQPYLRRFGTTSGWPWVSPWDALTQWAKMALGHMWLILSKYVFTQKYTRIFSKHSCCIWQSIPTLMWIITKRTYEWCKNRRFQPDGLRVKTVKVDDYFTTGSDS